MRARRASPPDGAGREEGEKCHERKWSDIDFKTSTLRVNQSVSIPRGKPVFANGKTQNAIRDIPMPASLVTVLKRLKESQDFERKHAKTAWVKTDAVFATQEGRYVHPDNLGRVLLGVLAWSNPSVLEDRKKRKRKDGVKVRALKRPLSELSNHEKRLFGLPVPSCAKL